jgi:hypothetical protein
MRFIDNIVSFSPREQRDLGSADQIPAEDLAGVWQNAIVDVNEELSDPAGMIAIASRYPMSSGLGACAMTGILLPAYLNVRRHNRLKDMGPTVLGITAETITDSTDT